ncbi:molybdopterin-dependent oxidoreductase [Ramlibacter humi]|uniref:Molybdopterin-binding protein n=1 Tax=Ramlibacter humi TaxID=2530451 RepID=A0A4Z0BEX2_9BURK|nr:molybdopterin-dependent oxidoreductase [Ramlibacter humi]TFY96654.1 molybdopterin-binding protein [Ramlibacter humi]
MTSTGRSKAEHGRERRRLLRAALATAAGGVLAGCDRLSHDERAVRVLGSAEALTREVQRRLTGPALAQEFSPADIAPVFRSNGTTLPGGGYAALARDGFANWRLRVEGLVERPAAFTLAQLRAMPSRTQITRHDCVEGWSCIGQWTGVPLSHVLQLVGAKPQARYVVFHCMDVMTEGDYRVPYYESTDMDEALHPQTLLAWGLNGGALPIENGAPLRARIERQLGYKQPKYLHRVELVDSFAALGRGHGGYWEDLGYNWYGGI